MKRYWRKPKKYAGAWNGTLSGLFQVSTASAPITFPKRTFDGADEMAFYRHYPLEITFFYRESKQKSDFEGEKKFEAAAAGAGEFSCTMGYDSANNLFYTQYVFDITEHIEEE
ncbi:MAG: hypothetical protein L6V87_09705 [Ruminococcus sp.]|nr:MAG: hypothetical protein L6V87_09705 [Ruminococcus sp.]